MLDKRIIVVDWLVVAIVGGQQAGWLARVGDEALISTRKIHSSYQIHGFKLQLVK